MTLIKVPLLARAEDVYPFKCQRDGEQLQLVRLVRTKQLAVRCPKCDEAQVLPASTAERVENILQEK